MNLILSIQFKISSNFQAVPSAACDLKPKDFNPVTRKRPSWPAGMAIGHLHIISLDLS